MEPEGTPVDLSAAWEEYFETHTFADLKPPERKRKPSEAEKSILEQLAALELNLMTPMQALTLLQNWKQSYVLGNKDANGL